MLNLNPAQHKCGHVKEFVLQHMYPNTAVFSIGTWSCWAWSDAGSEIKHQHREAFEFCQVFWNLSQKSILTCREASQQSSWDTSSWKEVVCDLWVGLPVTNKW